MIILKIKSVVIFAVLLCFSFISNTHPSNISIDNGESTLILPIKANLNVLEARLNADIPSTLSIINEPNKVCIEAELLKTDIPFTSKQLKTKITPEIKCDVKGWVKRNGQISVSGSGSTLKFAFPIKAKVSAEALKIRETANAQAIIYVTAKPRINDDWSIAIDVVPDFEWSERPNLKLFGLIKVTIGSKVEPLLWEKMNEFVNDVPQILSELNLKEKIAEAWSDVQDPIRISDDPDAYVVFNPRGVAYSGFNIENNILKTTVSIKGITQVMLGNPNEPIQKTELSSLGEIPYQDGKFSFSLPLFIPYNEVLAIANKKFPDGYITELQNGSLKGTLKIFNPRLKKGNDGKLFISVDINYDNRSNWLKIIDIFDWFDIDGAMTFEGNPHINPTTRILSIKGLEYDSSTNSKLFDALVDVAGIEAVRNHLASHLVFAYGPSLDEGVMIANEALNITSEDGINLSASLQSADIDKLSINDRNLRIDAKLSGFVSASLGL